MVRISNRVPKKIRP